MRVEARFTDGSVLTGTATALNADASLSVRDNVGKNHVVHTADVGVLPLSSQRTVLNKKGVSLHPSEMNKKYGRRPKFRLSSI